MAIAKKRRPGISAEPNLTPILDMVFQLITFFMLVISFKVASLDPGIRLPVLGNAHPAAETGGQDFVILNIDSAGDLRVLGETAELEAYLQQEAASFEDAKKPTVLDAKTKTRSKTAIIRADRLTPFRDLNRVMAACKKHGYQNVSLKVLEKTQE